MTKPLPIKHHTQRQRIARTGQCSVRTVARWRAFCEANSLDWHRTCPDGRTTPRYLHPYQTWLLNKVLENRDFGKEWLAEMLLRDPQWGYENWKQNHARK